MLGENRGGRDATKVRAREMPWLNSEHRMPNALQHSTFNIQHSTFDIRYSLFAIRFFTDQTRAPNRPCASRANANRDRAVVARRDRPGIPGDRRAA